MNEYANADLVTLELVDAIARQDMPAIVDHLAKVKALNSETALVSLAGHAATFLQTLGKLVPGGMEAHLAGYRESNTLAHLNSELDDNFEQGDGRG